MANATTSKGRRVRRRSSKSKSAGSRGRTLPWLFALVATAGAIAAYEHRPEVQGLLHAVLPWTASRAPDHPRSARDDDKASPSPQKTAQPLPRPAQDVARRAGETLQGEGIRNTFYFCGTSGLDNCVASGDLFWFKKQAVRLADVAAPQTDLAKCQAERDRGFAAKVRLRDLLNAGAFEIVDWPNRDEDERGRKLRVVTRNGQSIGAILVREGLAHGPSASGKTWC